MLEVVRTSAELIDLVLLDVDMPRLNGWEALAQLKKMRPEARVVLLSGGVVDSDLDQARARGADGFLAKPFKNEQLVQMVRKILDETESRGHQARPAPAP
jgi:CheY-like chemotaxis protein